MFCTKCLMPIAGMALCEKCAKREQEYVDAFWKALTGGVFLDSGTLRNVRRAMGHLKRHEKGRENR